MRSKFAFTSFSKSFKRANKDILPVHLYDQCLPVHLYDQCLPVHLYDQCFRDIVPFVTVTKYLFIVMYA